jgi:hypothetical protein
MPRVTSHQQRPCHPAPCTLNALSCLTFFYPTAPIGAPILYSYSISNFILHKHHHANHLISVSGLLDAAQTRRLPTQRPQHSSLPKLYPQHTLWLFSSLPSAALTYLLKANLPELHHVRNLTSPLIFNLPPSFLRRSFHSLYPYFNINSPCSVT